LGQSTFRLKWLRIPSPKELTANALPKENYEAENHENC
jgi:hypothetical protein